MLLNVNLVGKMLKFICCFVRPQACNYPHDWARRLLSCSCLKSSLRQYINRARVYQRRVLHLALVQTCPRNFKVL